MFFRKIAYWLSYSPFKLNFFILAFIVGLGSYWTKSTYFLPDLLESHKLLFELIFKMIWLFAVAIISVSLLSLILPWVYSFMIRNNAKGQFAKISFGVDGFQAEAGKVPFTLSFNGLLRPLLGTIKARVVFDDLSTSRELQLDRDQHTKSKLLRSGIYSAEGIYLSDRKKYEIHKVFLFFEDMFRLFSLPSQVPFERQVYTVSPKITHKDVKILPNKTTEQTVKIETPQKVQGELFNYKNFESGDDIRRIVWKIFAKNRELVVRVPEVVDPHASEIELFASFHSAVAKFYKSAFDPYLLNAYKDRLRIVYETAKGNGFVIKHHPDQSVDQALSGSADPILYNLSLSSWQEDQGLEAYVGNRKSGILCISSLTDVEELSRVLARSNNSFTIFYVKLSAVFRKKSALSIAKLFVRMEENRDTVMKRKWLFSPLKSKIQKNERALEKELQSQLSKVFTI